jgi:hypothetical protein
VLNVQEHHQIAYNAKVTGEQERELFQSLHAVVMMEVLMINPLLIVNYAILIVQLALESQRIVHHVL